MFLTVHATAGALIGQATGNIWLGFLAGLISHYLLDIIPHGDETIIGNKTAPSKQDIRLIIKIATVDGLIMTALLATLYWQNLIPLTLPVLAGIAGSILPDFLNGTYLLTKHPWLKRYSLFHFDFHYLLKLKVSFPIGLVIQLVTLILLLAILI